MPFVNDRQRRACYAQEARDKKAGRTPKWNCSEYGKHKKKCNAKCNDGSKCKRTVLNGKYCYQHLKN